MKWFTRKRVLTAFIALISSLGNLSFADPGPTQNYIGMNIGTTQDWEGTLIFADAMKQARPWDINGTSLSGSQIDAQGWPKVAANIIVWAGLVRDNSGTYALSFVSDAPVSVSPTLQNVVRNASTGVTTAQLVLTGPNQDLIMSFSGPVRNVKLMRPIAPGSGTSHATTEDFSRPFLSAVAPFHVLRFMDYLSTYGNPQVNWSDRVPPDSSSFNHPDPAYSWIGRGGAWEYIIKLCNQTKKDAWICVPLLASDDFVHQLAKLFRDGNSFTGGVGLDPSLKLYIEYANEVWNTAGAFDGNRNHDLAIAEKNAGDAFHYNYDSSNNDWFWSWRRTARRALDISVIFRQEFGDAKMMTQIRPVFEWQLGNGITGLDPLEYLENAYLPALAPNKPVSYFFYAGGGSAYYGPDHSAALNLSNFWQSGTMDPALFGTSGGLDVDAKICSTFGLKRVAYEGGPSLDATGNTAIDSVQAQAWADPRMGTEITEHQTAWSQWGGDMLIYFSLFPGDYQWGFVRKIDDLTLPKYVATAALNNVPRAAITHFNAVPNTLRGNGFDINFHPWESPGTSPGSQAVPAGQWSSYVFNVASSSTVSVTGAYSGATGARLSLLIDGSEAASKTASGTGTIVATVGWAKGIHSVRLMPTGSGVTVDSVAVSTSSSVDTTPPSPPATLTATATSPTTVTLNWAASSDNIGVTGYTISRENSVIGTSTTASFSDTGLAAGTTVTYSVSAHDAAGNSSAQSSSATVTTPPAVVADTQPPTMPSGLVSSNLGSNAVTLTWNPSSDNVSVAGYNVFRNGTKINTTLIAGTSLGVSGLAPSTLYSFTVQSVDAAGNQSAVSLPLSVATSAVTSGLPAPWVSQNIGTTAIAGSVTAIGNTFSVTASGADIWGTADAFRYVYQSVGNSSQITARLGTQTNSNAWAKAGIMIRQSLDANSAFVNLSVTPSNGITLQRRASAGASADMPAAIAGTAPTWLRLTRNGNNFIAFGSADGSTWTQIASTTCTVGSTAFAGLSVTAHNAAATSTASFDNVVVSTTTITPPPPTPVPVGSKVISFSSLPVGALPNPYNDPSGYSFTGSFALSNFTNADPLQIRTIGTNNVLINGNSSSKIVLNKTGGAPFSLTSFRYASDPWNGLADAVVTGTTSTGATVVANYTATSTTLQTLTLNWSNLTSVVIQFSGGVNDSYGMVDDFTVSP